MKSKRKPTKWNKHLDEYREEHPKMSLSEAMKKASKTYKKE